MATVKTASSKAAALTGANGDKIAIGDFVVVNNWQGFSNIVVGSTADRVTLYFRSTSGKSQGTQTVLHKTVLGLDKDVTDDSRASVAKAFSDYVTMQNDALAILRQLVKAHIAAMLAELSDAKD